MKKIDYRDIAQDNALRLAKLPYRRKESYLKLKQYLEAHERDNIDLYSAVALTTLEKGRTIPKDYAKYVAHIKDSEQLRAEMKKIRDRDYEKYTITHIWSAITILVCLFFLQSWLTNHYLLNYWLDIVVALVAFILSILGFIIKYRLLEKYHVTKAFFFLDVAVVVGCVMIKFFLPSNFDITLVLLIVTYFISQRGMKKVFSKVIS